ncbi:MAG TPA: hypothetical protein VFK09_07540 [Gemmatimonadales bacterium]|nr:hypothetical protein [Gemmatimonadales bacterium]
MPRPWWRRFGAFVLTVLFVGGSFGVSGLDALAYHRAGGPDIRPHFEAAGTTCGHADRCVLGVTFPGPRLAPPLNVVGRLARVLDLRAAPAPATAMPAAERRALPQPRAPPRSAPLSILA